MSGFIEMFSFGNEDDDSESPQEPHRPRWFGPPDDELGVVCPQAIILARSENAVIALSHATVYSTGIAFDFLAQARGLTRSQASRLFHEQHTFEEEDLPDAFLRIGFEFGDGRRVSNLGGWRGHSKLMQDNAEPEGPLLIPYAGGGGNSNGGNVTMKPGYWLWPLPPSGPLRISCEWPLVRIAVTTVQIDAPLLENAQHVTRLWP